MMVHAPAMKKIGIGHVAKFNCELKGNDVVTTITFPSNLQNTVGQGPFVMNTREEIQESIRDYRAEKMGNLS
jgi:hypothetical protein